LPGYLSGAEALADGRLRIASLPTDQGILFVEGRDDVRLFAPLTHGIETIIPCGAKWKLLDAHSRLRVGEGYKFVFVADCDYDVPAQRLRPQPNLILTATVDVESDLIALGLAKRLVLELVPSAVTSDEQLSLVTTQVVDRAMALAVAIGRLRQVSAVESLGLTFQGIRHSRHRATGTSTVDVEKLTRRIHGGSEAIELRDLAAKADQAPSDCRVCHGKDFLVAIATVLHDDFGVPLAELKTLPRMLRAALSPVVLDVWDVTRRIRRWETASGRRILRPAR
jgi:hypothetical protein